MTTTTTYHLRAVTDAATTKTHLGATERGNVTFCGASAPGGRAGHRGRREDG